MKYTLLMQIRQISYGTVTCIQMLNCICYACVHPYICILVYECTYIGFCLNANVLYHVRMCMMDMVCIYF